MFGLAKLIEAKGLTQTAAADLIGIARPDLSKILRGNLTASLERLLNVMRALGWKPFLGMCIRANDGHCYCSNECADEGDKIDLSKVESLKRA